MASYNICPIYQRSSNVFSAKQNTKLNTSCPQPTYTVMNIARSDEPS